MLDWEAGGGRGWGRSRPGFGKLCFPKPGLEPVSGALKGAGHSKFNLA